MQFDQMPMLDISADKLLKAMSESEPEALADIVLTDPVSTSRFLSIANSSAYAGRASKHLTNVFQAIIRIGMPSAKSLLISLACNRVLDTSRVPSFDTRAFWQNTLVRGDLVRELSMMVFPSESGLADSAKAGALLAEIGLLLIADQMPNELQKAYLLSANSDMTFGQATEHTVGHSIGDVTHRLLTYWGVPEEIAVIPVSLTLKPRAAHDLSNLVSIVHTWEQDGYHPDSSALMVIEAAHREPLMRKYESIFRSANALSKLI